MARCNYCIILYNNINIIYLQTPLDRLFGSNINLLTEVKSLLSKMVSCVHLDPSVFPKEKFRLSAEYNRHKKYL